MLVKPKLAILAAVFPIAVHVGEGSHRRPTGVPLAEAFTTPVRAVARC